MTTKQQKRAVWFCENMLDIEFEGDINDPYKVSEFLNEHLYSAKCMAEELSFNSDIY